MRHGAGFKDEGNITTVVNSRALMRQLRGMQLSASKKHATTALRGLSCAAGVQQPFERGVALMHSFWYDEAEKQFKGLEKKDPGCAMIYWGEAVSLLRQFTCGLGHKGMNGQIIVDRQNGPIQEV